MESSSWNPRFEQLEIWVRNTTNKLYGPDGPLVTPKTMHLGNFGEIVKCLVNAPRGATVRIFWADAVASIESPDLSHWMNHRDRDTPGEENLVALLWQNIKGEPPREQPTCTEAHLATPGIVVWRDPVSESVKMESSEGGKPTENNKFALHVAVSFLAQLQKPAQRAIGVILDCNSTELCFVASRCLQGSPQPQTGIFILGGHDGIAREAKEELHSAFAAQSVSLVEACLAPNESAANACLAFLRWHENAGRLKAAVGDLQHLGPRGYRKHVEAVEACWFKQSPDSDADCEDHLEDLGEAQPLEPVDQRGAEVDTLRASFEMVQRRLDGEEQDEVEPDFQRQQGHLNGGMPITPAMAWASGVAGKGRKAAAQVVKELQRTDPTGNAEWWAFCDIHGGGLRDPCRHTLRLLHKFITDFHSGLRLKGSGNKGGVPELVHVGLPPGLGFDNVGSQQGLVSHQGKANCNMVNPKEDEQSMLLNFIKRAGLEESCSKTVGNSNPASRQGGVDTGTLGFNSSSIPSCSYPGRARTSPDLTPISEVVEVDEFPMICGRQYRSDELPEIGYMDPYSQSQKQHSGELTGLGQSDEEGASNGSSSPPSELQLQMSDVCPKPKVRPNLPSTASYASSRTPSTELPASYASSLTPSTELPAPWPAGPVWTGSEHPQQGQNLQPPWPPAPAGRLAAPEQPLQQPGGSQLSADDLRGLADMLASHLRPAAPHLTQAARQPARDSPTARNAQAQAQPNREDLNSLLHSLNSMLDSMPQVQSAVQGQQGQRPLGRPRTASDPAPTGQRALQGQHAMMEQRFHNPQHARQQAYPQQQASAQGPPGVQSQQNSQSEAVLEEFSRMLKGGAPGLQAASTASGKGWGARHAPRSMQSSRQVARSPGMAWTLGSLPGLYEVPEDSIPEPNIISAGSFPTASAHDSQMAGMQRESLKSLLRAVAKPRPVPGDDPSYISLQ